MWSKILKGIKKNVVWLILMGILLTPQLRIPVQIWFNKGFSYINRISVSEELKNSNLSELVLVDRDNNQLKGTELNGKVVFINNWATWCPPCIAEMPSIQELHNEYKGKVEFILISNESFKTTNAFLTRENYSFKTYRPIRLPDNLSSRSIPTTYIINTSGNTVVEKSGAVNWNSEGVRSLLDDLIKDSI